MRGGKTSNPHHHLHHQKKKKNQDFPLFNSYHKQIWSSGIGGVWAHNAWVRPGVGSMAGQSHAEIKREENAGEEITELNRLQYS